MVSLIGVIIALVLVGLVLYLVNLIPMDITIKKTIHLVVMIVVVIWLLQTGTLISQVVLQRVKRLRVAMWPNWTTCLHSSMALCGDGDRNQVQLIPDLVMI